MVKDNCEDTDHHDKHESSHHHETHFKREYLDKKTERYEGFFFNGLWKFMDESTKMFRNLVLRLRGEPYAYYHRIYPRVPLIDECFADDVVCLKEAELQYNRDRMVESQIIRILRSRKMQCIEYYSGNRRIEERESFCLKEKEDYQKALENYFIKYGDVGHFATVVDVYMKQKHRMIWERRYGPQSLNNVKCEKFIKEDESPSMITILRRSFGGIGLPKNM